MSCNVMKGTHKTIWTRSKGKRSVTAAITSLITPIIYSFKTKPQRTLEHTKLKMKDCKSANHITYFLHELFKLCTINPLANTTVTIAFHLHHKQVEIIKGPFLLCSIWMDRKTFLCSTHHTVEVEMYGNATTVRHLSMTLHS